MLQDLKMRLMLQNLKMRLMLQDEKESVRENCREEVGYIDVAHLETSGCQNYEV